MNTRSQPIRPGKLCVGLTGGIASGKSTVADMFAELGVPIIDTDIIAREVVEPGTPALAEIRERFGEQFIDAAGNLDRAAAGVFELHAAAGAVRLDTVERSNLFKQTRIQ